MINAEVRNLASLVTFRQLYNDGKSDIYYIISKFAESIIISQKLYSFGMVEISEKIRTQFGFDIPDYVIQTSLKRLACLTKSNNRYCVDISKIQENELDKQFEEASKFNDALVDSLYDYAVKKKGFLSEDEKRQLAIDFCAYILDESNGNNFSDIISAFILKVQENEPLAQQINLIKEGAVLFAGINYNSNVSQRTAWEQPITLFVENEILFHLAGYNGEIFQRLATDLFSLIYEMNSKGAKRPIRVKYFKEVAREIEDFFAKAQDIVSGKDIVAADNYAMNEIVSGCESVSDVIQKKSEFFRLLKNKAISEADNYDYYREENYKYNLESPDYIEKYQLTEEKQHYIKHLNYVNILRQGKEEKDLKNAKYIVLTETGKMLRISNDICAGSMPLAVNMYTLTNRLWYDLNKGFGAKDFPSNFNILIKSQIVLSSLLSQSVSAKYEKARDDYKAKIIDINQVADTILLLREEAKKPEQIGKADVDEILDFISEVELDVYQSEKEKLQNRVKEKEQELINIKNIVSEQERSIYNNQIREQSWSEERRQLLENERKAKLDRYNDICTRKKKVDAKIDKHIERVRTILKISCVVYYLILLLLFILLDNNGKNILVGILAIVPPMLSMLMTLIVNHNINIIDTINILCEYIKKKMIVKMYQAYDIDKNIINGLENELKEAV